MSPRKSNNAAVAGSVSTHGARSAAPRGPVRRSVLLAIVALLVGVACVAYPLVSNALLQAAQGKVISVQQEAVEKAPEEDLSAERERATSYNERLLNGRAVVTDPFDPDAQRPSDEEYWQTLNLNGDGVMGTLVIPAIHVNLPIYHGTSDEVLQDGVGHLEGTSVPIGGPSTHSVLSGHTGLPSMKIFDALDQLEVGDYFIIQVLGEDHAYRVTSIEVVLPDETSSLGIQEGKDLCTLVTCTPYGVNSHRLLVHAERCEVPAEWLDKGDAEFPAGHSEPADKALLPSVLIGLAIAALIIVAYAIVRRLRSGAGARGVAPIEMGGPTGGAGPARAGKHFAVPGSSRQGQSGSGGGAVGMRPVLPRRHRPGEGRRRHG